MCSVGGVDDGPITRGIHSLGKGAGGKIFQETFSGMKGWKDKFFFLDRRVIPYAMAWRHHDFDVNDMLSNDGFSMDDVRTLAEKVIDLCPVHSGLLFSIGLATIWDFPGFHLFFKDTGGNATTMSKYLCFPFLFGVSIRKGTAILATNQIEPNTTPPLLVGETILDKIKARLEVEVKDPKVVAVREKKKA
ncbi:hypothetical protein Tco_0912258 [Tanacetum coccineum]